RDDVGELTCRRDRHGLARLSNRAGDGAGKSLFAENGDNARQVPRRRGRHYIRRAGALAPHPHVERTIEAERKAAFSLIKLHRPSADIQHHAIARVVPCAAADAGEVRESILDKDESPIGTIDEAEASGNGGTVAINPDYPCTRQVEDRATVAARSERRVDVD